MEKYNSVKIFKRLILPIVMMAPLLLNPLVAHADSNPYPASAVIGQTDFTSSSYSTAANTLDGPWGSTAIDTVNHKLFVADTDNERVLVYDLDNNNNLISNTASYVLGQTDFTSSSSGYAANSLEEPMGLAFDPVNDRLFVSTYYDVLVFDLSGGISNGMDASYEVGQPSGFSGQACSVLQTSICGYNGIAYDTANDLLFVEDGWGNRVMIFNVNPSTISTGENASYVLGDSDFTSSASGSDTQSTFGGFEYSGMAYDSTRHMLYVADSSNNRVLVFDLSNGITDGMNASYVLGQANFTSNASGLTQSTLDYPMGLGIDTVNDRLFVDDTYGNCRILVFDLAGGITNGMNASAVIGQPDFTSNSCGVTQTAINISYSQDIAFDPANERLYFPNYTASRVLVYNFVHLTNPSGSLGTVTQGKAVNLSLDTTNSQGTVTYAITGGSLPPGLSLDPTTGIVSGTPTSSGSYTFEVTVTDNDGSIGSFSEDPGYTITVNAAASPAAPNTGFGIASISPLSTIIGFSLFVASISLTGILIRRYPKT